MAKSLIEELPRIASEGRQEAQRIIERLSSGTRIGLQTNELVLPRKDVSGFFRGQVPNIPNAFNAALDGGTWMNRLIYGDNLLTMQALLVGDPQTGLPSLRGKVDLIYIDPPFDSKADYRTPITLPNASFSQRPTVIEQFAYADTWEEGTISYLKMIYPRLVLMKELLSDNGTIYVHIDWHVGAYMKLVLDEIFGKELFRNEIIWQKIRTTKAQSKSFGNVHDVIYAYSKSPNSFFTNIYVPYEDKYLESHYKKDDKGRYYTDVSLVQKGQGPARKFGDRWIEPPMGMHWIWSQDNIDLALEEGRIIFNSKGNPRKVQFLDDMQGNIVSDLWNDIYPVNSQAKEAVGYDTQKPEALLERIIKASSNEGDLVCDFFGGSGTTAATSWATLSSARICSRWRIWFGAVWRPRPTGSCTAARWICSVRPRWAA
mgnify:FL=1